MLTIVDGKIVPHNNVTIPDRSKAVKKYNDYQADMKAAEDAYNTAADAADKAVKRLDECRDAAKKLDELRNATPSDSRQPEEIQADIDMAEDAISMINAVNQADDIHRKIVNNEAIQAVLAPDGLRRGILTKGMKDLTDGLASITGCCGWRHVYFDEDMGIYYGGRPYSLCSESERFRARVTLQLFSAVKDGSRYVIIDGADILDRPGRNALARAVIDTGIPTMVCLSLASVEEAPPVSKVNGIAYWIENGEAVMIGAGEAVTA